MTDFQDLPESGWGGPGMMEPSLPPTPPPPAPMMPMSRPMEMPAAAKPKAKKRRPARKAQRELVTSGAEGHRRGCTGKHHACALQPGERTGPHLLAVDCNDHGARGAASNA